MRTAIELNYKDGTVVKAQNVEDVSDILGGNKKSSKAKEVNKVVLHITEDSDMAEVSYVVSCIYVLTHSSIELLPEGKILINEEEVKAFAGEIYDWVLKLYEVTEESEEVKAVRRKMCKHTYGRKVKSLKAIKKDIEGVYGGTYTLYAYEDMLYYIRSELKVQNIERKDGKLSFYVLVDGITLPCTDAIVTYSVPAYVCVDTQTSDIEDCLCILQDLKIEVSK